jgi:hypothetical protein
MTWHISTTEDGHYYGEYATREDAILEGIAADYEKFWVGESRPPLPLSEGVYADAVIESALESLDDEWLLDDFDWTATTPQVEILQSRLRKVVDDWVKEQGLEPTWFVVDKVELIESSKEVG